MDNRQASPPGAVVADSCKDAGSELKEGGYGPDSGRPETGELNETSPTGSSLRSILDRTGVSYTLLTTDYSILDFNQRSTDYANALFGRPLLHGESILSYTTPESRQLLLRDLEKAFSGDEVRFEWEYEKNGRTYRFLFVHIPVYDDEDRVTRVAMCTIDLTERRNTEQRERELATAIERSPISVVMTDAAGSIRYVNPFFEQLTGYTADEVLGTNPRFLQSGRTEPEAYRQMWSELFAGRSWQGEFTNTKKDGELYQERAVLVPITDEDGRLRTVVGIKEDITPLQKTIEDLERKERHFRAIFENAGDAIYIHDLDGIIRMVNRAAIAQSGYSRSELVGMHIGGLDAGTGDAPPPSVAELLQAHSEDYGAGEATAAEETANHVRFQSYHRRKDGSQFPVEVMIYLFSSEDETLIGSTVTDITLRREQERRIEQSLREKEALVHELHHRVKNNLQTVASLIRLQTDSIRDEKDREVFEKNADRAQSMAMVHQLLSESHDLTSIDLKSYLLALAAYASDWASARYQPTAMRVHGDSVQMGIDRAVPLGLIVNELISNAVKYCCSDGEQGRVSVAVTAKAHEIELTVADSGSADATDFFKEHARGFGTQLVKLLAEQIGATVEPLPGAGGSIRVKVPGQ
jgi:PAS domain S-box-containing protein